MKDCFSAATQLDQDIKTKLSAFDFEHLAKIYSQYSSKFNACQAELETIKKVSSIEYPETKNETE